jgi:hypothetical protein
LNKNIVYSLVAVAGIILAGVVILKQNTHDQVDSNVKKPIMVDGKIPPQLSDLFADREQGPHQKYIDEKSCLACHKQEITIPGVGLVPKILHEFRPDCVSCHFLPSRIM